MALSRDFLALSVSYQTVWLQIGRMISALQIRAARALLGWSQQTLADKAIVSLNAVKRLESRTSDPRMSTVLAIQHALEKAGIEFLPTDGRKGEGLRIASA